MTTNEAERAGVEAEGMTVGEWLGWPRAIVGNHGRRTDPWVALLNHIIRSRGVLRGRR